MLAYDTISATCPSYTSIEKLNTCGKYAPAAKSIIKSFGC
jgi:hypothetical protein